MRFRDLLRDKSLTRTELAIVSYVVRHPEEATHLTVRGLAQASFTSPSAIMRLCKKTGFASFQDFKIELARQVSEEGEFVFSTADYPEFGQASEQQVVRMLGTMKRTAINETTALLQEQDLRPVIDALESTRGVTIVGLGSSFEASSAFSLNLSHLGYQVKRSSDYTDLCVWIRACPESEVLIVCSYSGETPMANVARLAAERDLKVISITAETDNTLAATSTWNIRIPEIEGRFNTDRVAAFCSVAETEHVLDVLYAILFSRNYTDNIALNRRSNGPVDFGA